MRSVYSPTVDLPPTPDGLDKIIHKLYWSVDLVGYIEEFIGSVNFTGDGYNNLRALFMAGGSTVVPVVLADENGVAYNANIVVNDIEWNIIKRVATCEFVDAGYLSLIDINADIEVTLNTRKTKSALDMMSNIETGLTYVLPDNTVFASNRVGVSVDEALRTIVTFISDGQITYTSDYFASGDVYPVLISGRELRTGGGDISPQNGSYFPTISFSDLYRDLANIFCLSFSHEGQSTIRIEPRTYFAAQTGGITIPAINGAKVNQKIIEATFYAKMQFGGQVNSDYTFLPQLRFLGFDEEEYHVTGQGNNRTALDLRISTIIVDTNAIQQVIEWGDTGANETEYDDNVFMVWHHRGTNLPVLTPNPVSSGDYYYNELSSNFQIANRWFGSVPFSVYNFFGFGDNQANAVLQTQAALEDGTFGFGSFWAWIFLQLPNTTVAPAYDPLTNMAQINGGPWDVYFPFMQPLLIMNTSATYTGDGTFYVVPVSGVYTVNVDITYSTEVGVNPAYAFIAVYDSSDNLLQNHRINDFGPPMTRVEQLTFTTPIVWNIAGSVTLAAAATDRICVVFFGSGAVFNCVFNPNGAYINSFTVDDTFTTSQTYDERQARMVSTEVKLSLDDATWQDFRADPHKKITINFPDGDVSGYLRNFERNTSTEDATLEIDSTFGDIFQ
jgi:hypothetical protein